MASRPEKLRRLNDFRRNKPHCTASAMSEILADIRENGLPEMIDRKAMRQARDLITATPGDHGYGPLLQTLECTKPDGSVVTLPVASPFAKLKACIVESNRFRGYVKNKLREHPPSPEHLWNIVLYSDEVTPGNPLATANERKFQGVYWSVLEIGATALSHEDFWFPMMTHYSNEVKSLSGVLRQVSRKIMCFFPATWLQS